LTMAAAPFSLRLAVGETSYRGILGWDPGAIVRQAPFTHWAARALGVADAATAASAPSWLTALLAPAWLAGYLGLGGLGAIAFVLFRRDALTEAQVFALGVALAGVGPVLLLGAQTLDPLFFLYNGQLLLAVLAGGGLVRAMRGRPTSWGLVIALGLAALPSLHKAGRVLLARPGLDQGAAARAPGSTIEDYASGLAWLRAHAVGDVVVFADNPSLLLSAFGECRMYYETGLYSPRGREEPWEGRREPYPERAAFQEALLRRPGSAVVSAALRLFPPPVDVLVVADSVQSRIQAGLLEVAIGPVPAPPLLPPPWFRPVFVNRALHIYRLGRAGEADLARGSSP